MGRVHICQFCASCHPARWVDQGLGDPASRSHLCRGPLTLVTVGIRTAAAALAWDRPAGYLRWSSDGDRSRVGTAEVPARDPFMPLARPPAAVHGFGRIWRKLLKKLTVEPPPPKAR